MDEHPSPDLEGFHGGGGYDIPFCATIWGWRTVVLHGEVHPFCGPDALGHVCVAKFAGLDHADHQVGCPVVEGRKVACIMAVAPHLRR